MKTRAIAAALLIAFAPVAAPLPAFAQDDPLTIQARARFKEGVEFYDKAQYENARAAFLQAYALKNHPAVLLNLAQSCLRSNHALEAVKYFTQYLHQAQNPTPQQRHDAETGLEEARSKVGHVDILAPQGTEVSIVGGDRLGNAPFGEGVDLDPGAYTFKSRATDGSSESVKVLVVAGQRAQVKFGGGAGVPVPVPVPVPTTAPTTPPPNPNPAFPDNGGNVTPPDNGLGNGQNPPPDTGVSKKPSNILAPPKTLVPVFVGAGVGVVSFIIAGVLVVIKGSAQNNADQVATTINNTAASRKLNPVGICSSKAPAAADFTGACTTYKGDLDNVNQDATGANFAVGLGVAGLVFAAGWYLLAPKKDAGDSSPGSSPPPNSTSTTSFTISPAPIIGSRIGGFSVIGTF